MITGGYKLCIIQILPLTSDSIGDRYVLYVRTAPESRDTMRRQGNKLTPTAVRGANKPGLYGDGHGLYLQVSAFDTKSWVFRYMINGRAPKWDSALSIP